MKRLDRIGWRWVLLLSLALLGAASRPAWAEDKKPVHLDILLPEDAELEISGYKTKSTGATRRFESSPVEMGRTYRYTLKVSWRGHTITRRTEVRPEQPLTLDLRKELEALSKPEKKPTSPLKIQVEHKPEPAPEKTVSPKPEVKPAAPAETKVEKKPASPPKIQVKPKPETKPALAPRTKPESKPAHRLHVFSPSQIVLHPGQTEYLEVKAVMEGRQPLPAEPSITLTAPSESSVACEMWIAFDFKAKQPHRTVGFALKASADSEPRDQQVRVLVAAGTMKTEHTITIRIQPQERKPTAKPEPIAPLKLVVPAHVELRSGKTTYLEMQVQTQDGSPLSEMPNVMLANPSDAGLRFEPWTSSYKPGESTCLIGIAVTAETTAQVGDRAIRVRAVSGQSSAEHPLHVTVLADR